MVNIGTPPVIPPQFRQYNSYVVDPSWQTRFTITWTAVLGFAVICSIPRFIRAILSRRALVDVLGIYEARESGREHQGHKRSSTGSSLQRHPDEVHENTNNRSPVQVLSFIRSLSSVVWWSLPGVGLNVGQVSLVVAYLAMTLVCMTVHVPLRRNPNRPGFMALAQIPVVFLFSMKNSIVSLLLGPGYGYEKLNFIHRWSGRCLFFGSLLHGILWIVDHRGWGIPVLGQKKEITGIIALVFLFLLILTSLKPIRKLAYEVFFVTHVLGFIGFLAALCYHTIFASRWILLGVAFYGFDIAIRFLRLRVKDAYLTPAGNQMTIVRVPHCDGGWIAGQHVHLRVFSNGRTLESHPLTILSAPPHISCISSPGIYLAVRSAGGWSQALSKFTTSEHQKLVEYLQQHGDSVAEKDVEVPTRVMLDGPYGGCSIDLGEYESVLLLSGGSGATFTIGLLDDIVGRCAKLNRPNGERTRRIQFVWCIRSFGAIEWFAPILTQIAETAELSSSLDLCIIAYVTCMCNPDAIPQIPNQDVRLGRPSVHALLQDMITPPSVIKLNPIPNPSANSSTSALLQVLTRIEDDFETSSDAGTDDDVVVTSSRDMIDAEHGRANYELRWVGLGGGLAVCVSGPESLTVEASNAAVKLSLARGVEIGGVGLHTEVFSI